MHKQPDKDKNQPEDRRHRPEDWKARIVKMKAFFETNEIYIPETMQLGAGKIHNVRKFISSHLAVVEHNQGIPTFRPYFDRLVEVGIYVNNNRKLIKLRDALASQPKEPTD